MVEENLDRLTLGIHTQTHLLALLCYSKSHGAQVAAQLQLEHFDGVHRDLAAAILDYRRKYKGQPPGRGHLSLLLEHIPVQQERLKTIKLLAAGLFNSLKNINRDHVVSLAIEHAKHQGLKNGVLQAAERLSKKPVSITEVEQILHKALRNQPEVLSPGIRFSDPLQSLRWRTKQESGFKMGINPLDKLGVDLKPGTLTLYLAGKNTGKSWYCIHVARSCLMQGARVLHLSLEMSQDQVAMRYHQNWLAMSLRDVRYMRTHLQRDKLGRASGWHMKERKAKLNIRQPDLEKILVKATDKWAFKWDRLHIQDFPTGTLTITQLENYLDYLSINEDFQPNVLIIDYPDLMKVDNRQYRLEIGDIYTTLRGLGVKRSMALICPSQINRIGMAANRVRSTHAAEDIRKIGVADTVLTYSQTRTEKQVHLARLTVEHSRDTEIGTEVVLAQSYHIGQYVIDAVLIGDQYRNKMDEEPKKGQRSAEEYDVDEQSDNLID